MAAPINSSALLQIDNDGGGVTFNAGFTFTAGRDAVLTLGHYSSGQSISGVTIGGTTATLIASANKVSGSENSARIYLAQDISGGTADVVITYSGGTDHFISGSVEEWEAGVFESSAVDTGTANSAAAFSSTPSASTAASTSQADTIIYAVMVANSTATNNNITGPTGYTVTWTEQDSANHEGGRGAWKEETTTGTKTATFGMINDGWGVAIVALKLAAGDTSAPALTAPTGAATSSTTATIGATTDEANGTMYAVVDTVTTTPSAAELEAGQDGDGGPAVWSGSQAIPTTGGKTFNVTGLAPNTAYSYFIGHKDSAGNFSNIVGGTFTTNQRAAPISDLVAGNWTPSTGADLYAVLDENPAVDADFMSTNTAADSCTVALAAVTDPASSAGHKVSYRLQGDGTSGVLVELLQGSTVIASWTHDPAPSSVTQFDQTLTGTQADSITDYTALRVRFTEI